MVVPIKTNLKGFIKGYLTVLNPILKLKDKELEVLGAFLMVWYTNRDKEGIELALSLKLLALIMSEASFNNHITSLRKKKVLIGRTVSPHILKSLDSEEVEVTYKLSWTK